MATMTDRKTVLISEASSGRGLGLAVRGSDASIVATQPTFGAVERATGHPYKRDLTNLEFHLLDTGHFALEEDGDLIAELIRSFLGRNISGDR